MAEAAPWDVDQAVLTHEWVWALPVPILIAHSYRVQEARATSEATFPPPSSLPLPLLGAWARPRAPFCFFPYLESARSLMHSSSV